MATNVPNGMGNGTSVMQESNDFRIVDLIQFKRSNDIQTKKKYATAAAAVAALLLLMAK